MPAELADRWPRICRGPQGKRRLAARKSALAEAQARDSVLVAFVCRVLLLYRQNKTCKHYAWLKSADAKLSTHILLTSIAFELKKKSTKKHDCKDTLKRIHFKKTFQNLNYLITTCVTWAPYEISSIDLPICLFCWRWNKKWQCCSKF